MLKDSELLLVSGGGITPTLLNSVARLIETLFELGQSVGMSIKKLYKKFC